MNKNPLKRLIIKTVSKHTRTDVTELEPDTGIDDNIGVDAAALYRILVDLDAQLELGSSDGDWSFEGSIQRLVDYYDRVLRNRDQSPSQWSPIGQ